MDKIEIGNKYEWVRGDYIGLIEEVEDIKENLVIFKSGRRCYIDIFNEYLLPVINENDKIEFNENNIIQQNLKDNISNIDIILKENNKDNNQLKDSIDSIILLIKQSLKEDYSITFDYSIKLPKKSIYFLLKEGFTDIDIDKLILDIIISKIDINELKEIIKNQLSNKIKEVLQEFNLLFKKYKEEIDPSICKETGFEYDKKLEEK